MHAGAANVLGLLCLRGVSTEGKGYGAEWRHRGKEATVPPPFDGSRSPPRAAAPTGSTTSGGSPAPTAGTAVAAAVAAQCGVGERSDSPTTDKGKGGGGAGGGGSGGAGAGAGAGSEANGGGGGDDDDDDDDPSGGWYRKPHGDRGWSPPSTSTPNRPCRPRSETLGQLKDVEIRTWGGAAKANGFEGGGVEGIGCSVNSLKWFARAAAQGHAAARLELDRWLPPVATSLEGLASGSRVFLGDFVAEGFEFLNGEAAVIDEIAENGTSCSVRLLA